MPLRLLLIEDSKADALLLVRELRKEGFDLEFIRVDTPQGLEAALDGSNWDAVIADYKMPAFTGLDALRIIQSRGLDLPFILVTGTIGEEKAVAAMKAGAHDFILKGNFPRLAPALKRELREAEIRLERQQALKDLRRAQEELELRVQQRTLELKVVNEELRTEIAEHERTEEALRESEERYRAVVEDQTEIISRIKADGTFSFVNDVYCKFFGKTRADLLGMEWYPLAFPDDLPIIEEQLRKLSSSNPVIVIENRVYSASGELRWMQFVNRGFFDTEGRLVEIQSVGRDISRMKEIENDLRSCAIRLIDTEEDLRKKLATELHDEIGRDLTVLGMNMSIINDSLNKEAPKKVLERIEDSRKLIESVSRTVRNIMAMLRPPVLDDYGLVAALRWHADYYTKRTGIAVSIQADEPFSRIKEEKEMALFRIAQEALINAAKHAGTGEVTITLRNEKGLLRFTVLDDGKGFTPASSTHTHNGSGLGLKIIRERAESMGGHFSLKSAPGKGTVVSIEIPLEEE